jgi:hypothetical protein
MRPPIVGKGAHGPQWVVSQIEEVMPSGAVIGTRGHLARRDATSFCAPFWAVGDGAHVSGFGYGRMQDLGLWSLPRSGRDRVGLAPFFPILFFLEQLKRHAGLEAPTRRRRRARQDASIRGNGQSAIFPLVDQIGLRIVYNFNSGQSDMG